MSSPGQSTARSAPGRGPSGAPAPASWAGTTLADRRAARRQRLLDVGLELLGTQGAAAVTVRSVCRQARLTDRYFYENFADREKLMLAVFDAVADEATEALLAAIARAPAGDFPATARLATEAFLAVLTDDPRKGRVLLLEPLTDVTLGTRGVAVAPVFAELVRDQLGPTAAPQAAELTATALIGALANLFIRWLDGALCVGRADLVDYCVRLLTTSVQLAR